jgi:hypothetical protein
MPLELCSKGVADSVQEHRSHFEGVYFLYRRNAKVSIKIRGSTVLLPKGGCQAKVKGPCIVKKASIGWAGWLRIRAAVVCLLPVLYLRTDGLTNWQQSGCADAAYNAPCCMTRWKTQQDPEGCCQGAGKPQGYSNPLEYRCAIAAVLAGRAAPGAGCRKVRKASIYTASILVVRLHHSGVVMVVPPCCCQC